MAKKQEEDCSTRPEIKREWCKGCGICVQFCPQQVLKLDDGDKAVVEFGEQCIGCGMCERRCPDLAVELACCGEEEAGVD